MKEKEDFNPEEIAELLNSGKVQIEFPTDPCASCYRAEWQDLYGTLCYCCDMSYCIQEKDEG